MNNSVYAFNAFLVMMAAFAGAGVLCLLLAFAAFLYGRRTPANRSATLPRVVMGLLTSSTAFGVLTLGGVSGFDFLHPAIAFIIACLWCLINNFLSLYILYGQWRPSAVATSVLYQRQQGVELMALLGKMISMSLRHTKMFNVMCAVGYLGSYVIIFVLYGICFCSNPFQLTTWASRRDQPRSCFPDTMCHQYVLLGNDSSRVRLVSHLITTTAPIATFAQLCSLDVSTLVPDCRAVNRTITGKVVAHIDYLNEDPRYISQVLLTNLTASSAYSAVVHFILPDGRDISSSLQFRTVPGPTDRAPVDFISGGDLLSTNVGQGYLFLALVKMYLPSFVAFGGDLSYSNNMRTCYLRFDYFCSLIASLRTREGISVPLVIVPGNHESGGYVPESSKAKYNFYIAYFPQFDDDEPSDPNDPPTHHSHVVGQLMLLGLDSGLMESTVSQVPWVVDKLKEGIASNRTLIAIYHNPIFPSIRAFDDVNSVKMRNAFLDVFTSYNVTLALENHDHAYKRTFMVTKEGWSAANKRGVTFIGDGGLGTDRDSSNSGAHPYVKVFVATPNVQTSTCFSNGSILIRTYDGQKSLLDSVLLDSQTYRGG